MNESTLIDTEGKITEFSDVAIGLSEWEATMNARKWERFGYKVRNIKLIKEPSFLGKLFHPIFSGYYAVSFRVIVEENKPINFPNKGFITSVFVNGKKMTSKKIVVKKGDRLLLNPVSGSVVVKKPKKKELENYTDEHDC